MVSIDGGLGYLLLYIMQLVEALDPLLAYLNPFANKPWFFTCLQYKSFENTLGKGEIDRNEQSFLFQQRFLPVLRTFRHFLSNQKLPSANPFSLEASRICCLGKVKLNFIFS